MGIYTVNRSQHRRVNVEIGTETPIFLFCEYLFRNFGILSLQCVRHNLHEPAALEIKRTDYLHIIFSLFCNQKMSIGMESEEPACKQFVTCTYQTAFYFFIVILWRSTKT